MTSPKAILIAGPTASGKSALALRLAERMSGSIVNADSMQVYRDFRLLTARPTPAEESRAPHLLYGHVDAAENYSAGRWLADASRALAEVERARRLPIFVGGTGLYFRALTEGLSSMPPVPEAVRAQVRGEAEGVAAPELQALPAPARRVVRGLAALLRVADGLDRTHFSVVKALDVQQIGRASCRERVYVLA